MNFEYFMPTKVIMGENCILKNASVFEKAGKKALIVTGRSSAYKNGSLEDVTLMLDSNRQQYEVFNKIQSNPTIDSVYEGAKAAKDFGADFIIAIGGGSPMDAAKAISVLACEAIDREMLFSGKYTKRLPMLFVPTTAGTGSEVTQYAILTNDALKTKTSMASPLLFPDYSFLDAKYMNSLSKTITINTAVDALSHAVEGYLSVRANEVSDSLALRSIGMIVSQFDNLYKFSEVNREQLLCASMIAGIVIAHTGTTAVHSMGYSLTYFKDIDHGRANGLLMSEFLRWVQKRAPERIYEILKAANFDTLEDFEYAINRLLGDKEAITAQEISEYAAIAIKAKNISNCVAVPKERDLLDIFEKVFL